MFVDFFTVAMDQIINQSAKLKYISGGQLKVPMVLRGCCGAFKLNGPHHSQSLHSWFINMPGLKVVMPSTLYDAKGLSISAIRDNDPVIYLEHKALYKLKGLVPEEAFDYLEAPIKRVNTYHILIPFSPVMENFVIPDKDRIFKAISIT